jgi:hypothetical protein
MLSTRVGVSLSILHDREVFSNLSAAKKIVVH